jgi:cytochrome c5
VHVRGSLAFVTLTAVLAAVSATPRAARQAALEPSLAPEVATLTSKYCVTCHNDKLRTAGLSLQNLDLADAAQA